MGISGQRSWLYAFAAAPGQSLPGSFGGSGARPLCRFTLRWLLHRFNPFYSMRLTLFLLSLCFALSTNLTAQLATTTSDALALADAPSTERPLTFLAYRQAETTRSAPLTHQRRRERTLLGDLDLTGIWGGPTYNYALNGNDWVLLRGGFGGLEFSDEVFLGYGGWKARDNYVGDEGSPEFDFQHSGFIFAYSPLRDNAIHPRITTIVGPGRVNVAGEGRDRMLVAQGTIGLELNLFQWFRLGIDGGYRFAEGIDSAFISDKDASGAVFQLEARFGFSW